MPFVQRVVSPIYISRKGHPPTQSNQKKQLKAPQQRATCSSTSPSTVSAASTDLEPATHNGGGGGEVSATRPPHPSASGHVEECEFDTVTNLTLSNALRQLASLVLIANDIFNDLQSELRQVNQRSGKLNARLKIINDKLDTLDPKLVTVRKYIYAT